MKKSLFIFIITLFAGMSFSQTPVFDQTISVNQTFSTDSEIYPFTGSNMYGVGVNGSITFTDDDAVVKIILRDASNYDYLIYDINTYLDSRQSFTFSEECEETCFFDGFTPTSVIIVVYNANVTLNSIKWCSTSIANAIVLQDQARSAKINEKITEMQDFVVNNQLIWQAGQTMFTNMYYQKKKEHYRCCIFHPAYEYYKSGFFGVGDPADLAKNYDYVDNFDWRNRHGANNPNSYYYDSVEPGTGWVTSPKCQNACFVNGVADCSINVFNCDESDWRTTALCWVFGPIAHIEGLANLYLNQHYDLDLSEQHIASCLLDTATISGGNTKDAYEFIRDMGVIDEACFPFQALPVDCEYSYPEEIIMIDTNAYYDLSDPTLNEVRQNIMYNGPIGSQLMVPPPGNDEWTHAMPMLGWDALDWDDIYVIGLPIDTTTWGQYVGATYWIYKNSYGTDNATNGYTYMLHYNDIPPGNIYPIETNSDGFIVSEIGNFDQSDVQCLDKDGDGYYNWGIGPKPPHCPPCPIQPDGDDSNAGLGPMDEFGFCSIIDSFTADFEVSLSYWRQSSNDDCDWFRWTGPGPNYDENPPPWGSNSTGPAGSPDSSDYYLLMNASYCGQFFKTAIIESPLISFQDDCGIHLSFSYHKDNEVWGNYDNSKISVNISYDGGSSWGNLDYWEVIGDQGDEWHDVSLSIPPGVNRISIKSNTGVVNSWWHDMAIDNITIAPMTNDDIWISSDETWDIKNKFVCGNIYIEPGATLTVTNDATLLMNQGSKIIVKRGAKLVLDDAIVTSATDNYWEGIEVWGNSNSPQYPTTQGWVLAKNGSKIENSVMGIYTNRPYPDPIEQDWMPNYTGGIVQIHDSYLYNNTIAIQFFPYAYASVSAITDSRIRLTSSYNGNIEPDYFVYISGMTGIDIINTTFDNQTANEPKYTGIYSINSQIYIDSEFEDPCHDNNDSEFKDLEYGIYATATSPSSHITIKHSAFSYNRRGIYISGMTAPQITTNCFLIKYDNPYNIGYGLYLDESTGYHVEGNIFDKSNMVGTLGIGIVVNNSGDQPNQIYRNEFIELEYGILAQDVNRNRVGYGLELKCNTYEDTETDKAVTSSSIFGNPEHGIAKDQGMEYSTPLPEHMAGNLFQDDGPPYFDDFDDINNQASSLTYHRPSNFDPDYPNVVPKDYSSTVTDNPVFIQSEQWTYENGCPPSEDPGGGEDAEELKAEITETEANITSAEATLTVLIDGGDTQTLNTEVETSQPPETMQLYNELMGKSPYLSDTVVESAIEKEDVLPNAMLRDIMVANPHTAKSDELMNKLDERWDPLPEYMKAQILQGKSIVSIREELESVLTGYHQQKARAFNKLVRFYRNDTENPSISSNQLVLLYQQDNSLNSKYNLVMLHFERGEIQAALNVLGNIPGQFSFDGDDLSNHQQMVSFCNIYSDLLNNGKSLTEADSSQIEQLIQLESVQQGIASVYARNVLLALGEIIYEEPILLPDNSKSAQAYNEYINLVNTQSPKQIEVYPNPTDDYIIISYKLEMEKPGYTIEISDINGYNLKTIDVAEKLNQLAIDIKDWKPGVYITTLFFNGNPVENVKFTIL